MVPHPLPVWGGTSRKRNAGGKPWYFNPPSPWGEGLVSSTSSPLMEIFQSTLPEWGGTPTVADDLGELPHFNPPSPRGEGLHPAIRSLSPGSFQSTLPVGGGTCICFGSPKVFGFQSTLPVRGGTAPRLEVLGNEGISIHPPRVGRDGPVGRPRQRGPNFNPPSPCGEGLQAPKSEGVMVLISIHPPRVGRDDGPDRGLPAGPDFNPPSPCGEGPPRGL